MADFDPGKYPGYSNPTGKSSGFDPAKYPGYSKDTTSDAGKEFRDKLFEGIKQRGLSTEDFLKGIASGVQNTGAFFTSSLPQPMQIPRYDPQPTSSQGRLPIEAGKIGASLLAAILTEGAAAPAMEAVGVPANFARVAASTAGGTVSAPSVDASPLTGATVGTIGAGVPEVGMTMLGKYLGKNVTPEQFEAARQAIPANIKAPIGELADSPRAKTRYGQARGLALSQADTPYQQIYDHLNEGVDSLTEGAPKTQTPNQDLYDEVLRKHDSAKEYTSDSYDDFAYSADKNKIPFNRDSYDNYLDGTINSLKKEIKDSPTSEDIHKGTLKILGKFKKDKIDNFTHAARQRKNIGKTIKQKISEEPTYDDTLLLGAKEALDKSMENSSLVDGEAFNKYLTAKNARIAQGKMEYLNDKDKTPFYKIRVKHGTPDDFINSHVKTGKNKDYSSLLSNLTNHLSEDGKKILANAHVNPKEDMSLAKKIAQIDSLSPTQRDLMFGDKASTANSVSKISGLYPSAASADFTPKTGYTAGKINQLLAEISGLSLGVGAGAATHSPAIIAGTAATAAALPAYGQLMQRALRSEALKNAHMKYLQRSGKEALTKATTTGQAMRTGLLALLGGNQNGT